MSDEQDRQEQSGPEGSEGSITWGRNNRGDLVIDGTIVERGTGIGPDLPLDPPPASQEEVESLREENDVMREREELIAAHAHIIENPVFKDILQQYVEAGAVEAPRGAPPSPADIIGYKRRVSEPEAESILQVMREYAETLPPYEQAELNSNHKTFCRIYDKFKAEGAGNLPKPPSTASRITFGNRLPEGLRESVERKRVHSGFVERPGPAAAEYSDEVDDSRSARKAYEDARRRRDHARQFGTPTEVARAEQQMIESHPAFREKRGRRTGGGLEGY